MSNEETPPETDNDGAVRVNGDWIAGVHRLEKLVAEQVDCDDALLVPDVLHEEAGGDNGVDVS